MEVAKKVLRWQDKDGKDLRLGSEDIDMILLVGGTSRIPQVARALKVAFPHPQVLLLKDLNPELAVVSGAALAGEISTSSDIKDVLILDAIPLSLGIEVCTRGVDCGKMNVIIPRNTIYPTRMTSETLHPIHDYQTSVLFSVYEGEGREVAENHLVGQFRMENIPHARANEIELIATFEIDVNGILTVTAKCKQNGQQMQLEIPVATNDGRLKEDMILRLRTDHQQLLALNQNTNADTVYVPFASQ